MGKIEKELIEPPHKDKPLLLFCHFFIPNFSHNMVFFWKTDCDYIDFYSASSYFFNKAFSI